MIRHGFLIGNVCGLALTGTCLIWLSRDGGVDFAVSRAFADAASAGFPLQRSALLERVGHTGLRWLALAIWLSAVVLATAGSRSSWLREWRGPLVFFSITSAITTVLIMLLKFSSAHSCPWDLDAFGGSSQWFPLLGSPGIQPGPGHCWPGGHAGGGFALLAGYFALRDRRKVLARTALAFALTLGSTMSLVQIARGAHFLSHNLWSFWIAWLCSCTCYLIWSHISSEAFATPGRSSGI